MGEGDWMIFDLSDRPRDGRERPRESAENIAFFSKIVILKFPRKLSKHAENIHRKSVATS